MQFFKKHFKRTTAVILTSVGLSLVIAKPAFADSSVIEQLLTNIAWNTYYILDRVNNFPKYLGDLDEMALSWISFDNAPDSPSPQMQTSFTGSNNGYLTTLNAQYSLMNQLTSDYFGTAVTKTSMPYANDMSFGSLENNLYFDPDPRKDNKINPAYNYIKNASGLNISHPIPSFLWQGNGNDITRYFRYYSAVTSVQTYNAFLLANEYASNTTGFPWQRYQNQLISQATASSWFSAVAAKEDLGVIFRQMLMYVSQSYVLQAQMVRMQQEQLMAQAMTNTLLILLNQNGEEILLRKAQGTMPSGSKQGG